MSVPFTCGGQRGGDQLSGQKGKGERIKWLVGREPQRRGKNILKNKFFII